MRSEHLKSKQLVSYSSNGNCIDVKRCNDIYFSLLQGMMEGARQKVCNAWRGSHTFYSTQQQGTS